MDIPDPPEEEVKNLLSEAEARIIGAAATRIANYRNLLSAGPSSGEIVVVAPVPSGGARIALRKIDVEAILRLLVEREGTLLTNMGVKLEEPIK